MSKMIEPRSGTYRSQRLNLHFVEWGEDGAEPVVLVHGFRDHCRAWDRVARELADHYHLYALDLRGHGDSDWSNGGTYSLDDFLYDLHRFVESRGLRHFAIVAHSMGAAVSLNYAGLFPERVRTLVAVEGTWQLERPAAAPQDPHKRRLGWLDQLDLLGGRPQRRFASLDEAVARFRLMHQRFSPDLAWHLAEHAARQHADGSFGWKYDPCVRVRAPGRYDNAAVMELWRRITCPVALVHGGHSHMGDSAALGLDRLFHAARAVTIDGAGHWAHHERPAEFMAVVRQALAG